MPASKGRDVQCTKAASAMQTLPALGHTQRNCGYAPRCVACGDEHPSGMCVTPK
jgi:hypothetical protein